MKVFENIDGLLIEVDPAEANRARVGRRVSQMNMTCLILFTAEEEAARDAEEADAQAQAEVAAAEALAKAEADAAARDAIAARLGLTGDELKLLLTT